MEFELNKAIEILKRTPKSLKALLNDLPNDWIYENEGINTWSAFDIVGHLIHGEKTDWIVRCNIILRDNSNKKFAEFDRFAQFENSKNKSLSELLNEFEQLRTKNINELISLNISNKELELEGIHPEFGTISLRQLISTWVVHDLGHISQISRVMAKQYKDEVGPWIEYLGILK
jgi:DinB superfamily